MLIKNISKLSDFGIFANCNNAGVCDFGKYNLFYGWNGAGKSTLSTLFRCLETKSVSTKFPAAKFSFALDNDSIITQANVGSSSLNVYTFNQEFIDENISWNTVVKSILLVDKEKIADREKLEELKKIQQTEIFSQSKEAQEIQKLEDALAKFATNSARHLKTSLQSIDTTDSYFLNYDKRKFETLVNSNLDADKLNSVVLNDNEILELTNAAKPILKPLLNFQFFGVNGETLDKAKDRLLDLLKVNIVSQTIQRLVDNNDIKTWVEQGIHLHEKHGSANCEFCGSQVQPERLEALEGHFNDSYKEFQNRLQRAKEWLESQYIRSPQLPVVSEFYEELAQEYLSATSSFQTSINNLNKQIDDWSKKLDLKISNPLTTDLTVEAISESAIEALRDGLKTRKQL